MKILAVIASDPPEAESEAISYNHSDLQKRLNARGASSTWAKKASQWQENAKISTFRSDIS